MILATPIAVKVADLHHGPTTLEKAEATDTDAKRTDCLWTVNPLKVRFPGA